jgi:hypothetical protein
MPRSSAWSTLIGSAGVIASFLLAYHLQLPFIPVERPEATAAQAAADGPRLKLVFLGSSTCGASRNPAVSRAVGEARSQLEAVASREGYRFVAVGISVERDWRAGVAFLEEFGQFDEIVSGGGWDNVGSRYVRTFPGARATPQLVVTTATSDGNETLLVRKIGSSAIIGWSKAPLVVVGGRQGSVN